MKDTIDEKLKKRKTKQPPKFIYILLGKIWKLLYFKKLGVNVTFKSDPREEKGAYFLISNHASRMDYIFAGIPLLPHTFNFVVGYNEFFRSHLKGIFNLLQTIPKKNFTPDLVTVREINRTIKRGGRIAIFPEGMSSINGANQPCAIGSGKLLKHYKVPVYYAKISGGYLTNTKYCLDERCGRVDVVFDKMFGSEDLEKLSADEIQSIMNEKLYNDDYEWNKINNVKFDSKGRIAYNMSDLLYMCPKCGKEFSVTAEGDTLKCSECGFEVKIDEYYNMHTCAEDEKYLPSTPKTWHDKQRAEQRKLVSLPDFSYSEEVEIGFLPDYEYLKNQATSIIEGKGMLTLTKAGLSFSGERKGEPYTFFVPIAEMPTYGMCTDVSRFYTFVNGVFVEFYPKKNSVTKWFLMTEELHRISGGKWQDCYPRA